MITPIRVAVLLVAGSCLWSGPASAVDVFFNGVRVTGLRAQSFKNCDVRFDHKGDVHVVAKGYTVKKVTEASNLPGARKPTGTLKTRAPETSGSSAKAPQKRYFLVSTGHRPGLAQFDVDVFINGKWARKVRSSGERVVADVTSLLRVGKNVINFTATKNYGGKPRASASPLMYLRVLVGEGTRGGGTVNITNPLADFRAGADKTAHFGAAMEILVK